MCLLIMATLLFSFYSDCFVELFCISKSGYLFVSLTENLMFHAEALMHHSYIFHASEA